MAPFLAQHRGNQRPRTRGRGLCKQSSAMMVESAVPQFGLSPRSGTFQLFVCTMWPLLGLLLLAGAAGAFRVPPGNETARMARFVAHACDWGALATISTHLPVPGQPFVNVFSISDGEASKSTGVPYMYLTAMEISVQDLQVNKNASLTLSLAQTSYCKEKDYDPQNPLCAHVIFYGVVEKVTGPEADFGKMALFSRHSEMKDWPPDHDWFVAKLNIANIWVLSHFGGIETVTPEDYFKATPY